MFRFLVVFMVFLVAFAANDLLAAENASWGQVKAHPAGKLVASNEKASGTREVTVSLRVMPLDRGMVAATVSVSNLAGRILAGWDVWVAFDESMVVPVEYQSGTVVGFPEENYGLGGFIVAQNPIHPWKVAVASLSGTKREGTLFTLIFQMSADADISGLDIVIEAARLYDEQAHRYSVAIGRGRAVGSGFLPGDVNGDGRVNITDALIISSYLGGTIDFAPDQFKAADYNQDGIVNEDDAEAVAHRDLGL